MERQFSNEDAIRYLRYGIGCAVELTFALWLLLHGEHYLSLSLWVAYFLFIASGACLLVGFGWYFFWAYERSLTFWYLASVASLVGAACVGWNRLFILGFAGWDLALAFTLAYAAVGYGLWHFLRFVIVTAFNILLFAVSELGSAWRGEWRR